MQNESAEAVFYLFEAPTARRVRRYRAFLAATAALAALHPAPARAADPMGETVIVTASQVPIAAEQSGSAYTVIDGQTLEQRQIETVFDALRDVPGVAVSRTGTEGSLSEIRLRGGEANHTKVLIDGVDANDPALSSEFNFAHLLTAGIERVEVLRGPQSALWGADAVTGVVNVITVAPTDGVFGKARAEVGSFSTREFSGLFNAGADNGGIALDADYLKTGGVNISETGSEKDGYENLTLGARGEWRPTPEITFSGAVRHVNGNNDTDSGFPKVADTLGDYSQGAFTYARGEARAKMFDGVLEAIAGASYTNALNKDFLSGMFADSFEGRKTKFDLQMNALWDGMVQDTRLQQRISVRGETAREMFEQVQVSFSAADQTQHIVQSGIAGEYWAGFGNSVFISLGGRHDWNERFADTDTWRATISAAITDTGARLHASAGTGVKNPDFFELFGFAPSGFTGNPALTAETSTGYDVGIEAKFFGERLKADVTYFHADLENEIFTDFSVFPNTARNGTGKSERKGVEFAATAYLSDGLSVDGAYTHSESSNAGLQQLRRPKDIGAIDVDYRFLDNKVFLSIGADFHGGQQDTDFTTFSTVTLPGYTLVRVSGSYDIGNGIALTARLENALNEDYEEVVGYRTRGFGVFAGLSARIGE